MKNYEQYKRLVRFTSSVILISIESGFYWYIWRNFYNQKMDIPYNRTGNWLIVAVYAILLMVFSLMYGGLKIGYLKTSNSIYSQTLASICANGMIYLQITLLTKHFQSVLPLLFMSAAEFLAISAWSFVANTVYRMIYPAKNILLVHGERPIKGFLQKLSTRNDCFSVKETVNISIGFDALTDRICSYEGVILCDVPSQMRNQILKFCYANSVRTYAVPKISDVIIRSGESLHLFDTPLILCRNNGFTFEQRVLKRFMDITLSLSALILLSPLFLFTAAAIKLQDGGPVFFFQKRCTKDGKVFSICKFRSMIMDAEKDGKPMPAIKDDPRIFPFGRFIRRTRIDELPQLFNILKGDMSLVGPRPERIEHIHRYSDQIPEFQYRLKVKGGLTGYAQVYGKYNTTAYDKLKLDLMYIQNYSLLLDIAIIFQTLKILFMEESTEGFTKNARNIDVSSAKNKISDRRK